MDFYFVSSIFQTIFFRYCLCRQFAGFSNKNKPCIQVICKCRTKNKTTRFYSCNIVSLSFTAVVISRKIIPFFGKSTISRIVFFTYSGTFLSQPRLKYITILFYYKQITFSYFILCKSFFV